MTNKEQLKALIQKIFHYHIYGYTDTGLEIRPINKTVTLKGSLDPNRMCGGFLDSGHIFKNIYNEKFPVCPKCNKEFRELITY